MYELTIQCIMVQLYNVELTMLLFGLPLTLSCPRFQGHNQAVRVPGTQPSQAVHQEGSSHDLYECFDGRDIMWARSVEFHFDSLAKWSSIKRHTRSSVSAIGI
jgi:hypothetical protein